MNLRAARIVDGATVLARWLLGAIFICMGAEKALDPVSFLKLLRAYDMVHSPLALNIIASALPWIEVFCGLLLVMGIAVRGTALLLAGLLAVFSVAVLRRALSLEAAQNIPFCAVQFDCGCGNGVERICVKLPENLALLLIALWLLAGRGRAFSIFYGWPERDRPDH